MIKTVSVFGTGRAKAGDKNYVLAEQLGRALAGAGFTIANGGYGGTMEASTKGAADAGGEVIGVTCSAFKKAQVNKFISREISTITVSTEQLHDIGGHLHGRVRRKDLCHGAHSRYSRIRRILIDHGARSAYVSANRPSLLLRLSSASFTQIVQEAPALATPFTLGLARVLAGRLRGMNKRYEDSVHFGQVAAGR